MSRRVDIWCAQCRTAWDHNLIDGGGVSYENIQRMFAGTHTCGRCKTITLQDGEPLDDHHLAPRCSCERCNNLYGERP